MNRWPRSSAVWLAHHWDEKATLSTVRRPASHSFLLFPLYHGPRTFDVKDELLLWMPSPIQEVPAQAVFSLFRAINVFCMTRSIVSMSVSSKTARIFTDGPAGGAEAVTLSTEAAATEQIAVPAASSSRSGTRSRSFASGAMTVVDCLVVAVDIAESHQDAIKNRIGNCFQPESPFFLFFVFPFKKRRSRGFFCDATSHSAPMTEWGALTVVGGEGAVKWKDPVGQENSTTVTLR